MNLKKIGKAFTSKSVGTGPSSYEERIYRAAVSQSLRNTALEFHLIFAKCLLLTLELCRRSTHSNNSDYIYPKRITLFKIMSTIYL